ncbi:hypothetical protein GCM10011512_02850 [Tersicoccus solisilvae]|uniref:Zinc finger CGNR domain-containing protein n=1 Tax=Tersicoccus solisilvae TaxID=1882339 RepID=A0ABQ1NQ03_9MICC|nr:CGNR zinc finger domain-containing protein [Tersicoccus solisilvae]GGC79685.1 hypothetical protein GCM10011512_02850 [Tersicoccus solisilvae]
MVFAHDAEMSLLSAARLVNTAVEGGDPLRTPADLDAFLDREQYSGVRAGDDAELREILALRDRVRELWTMTEDELVIAVNALLADARALPQLVKHDHWDWHLHATASTDPLAKRVGVETAMALVDVVRAGEVARLKVCAAEDCDAVLVDLSKNRSKRYCDVGNCGNRANVAAYRARKAAASG